MMTLPVVSLGAMSLVLSAWAFRFGVAWLGLVLALTSAMTTFVAWPVMFLSNKPRCSFRPF